MGYRRDNLNLRTFGYQDNIIRSSKIFRPIAGNCLNEFSASKIDTEPVPSRKTNRRP